MDRLEQQLARAMKAHLDGGKPRPPEGARILWSAFQALSRARSCGYAGPNPITFAEIEAYSRLMRIPFTPEHVRALRTMDDLWLERVNNRPEIPEGAKALPMRSEHKLTPAMFDLAMD